MILGVGKISGNAIANADRYDERCYCGWRNVHYIRFLSLQVGYAEHPRLFLSDSQHLYSDETKGEYF